jgi:hypothetical protein
MIRHLTPVFVLAACAVVLAGCGGGGSSSKSGGGSGTTTTFSASGKVNGITVGNCLNDDGNFLVQPNPGSVDGQSPAGVNFTLTFYKDSAAAQAAAAKKSKKTTAVVENGVVDFRGNPSIYAGAPPAKISPVELKAIKDCMDKARG